MKPFEPIAIVGMSCVFPGAPDLDTFWRNIVNKVDTTREVPPDRWGVDPATMVDPDPKPDKAYSRRCCLISDFQLDEQGLEIDKTLLAALDPMHRLVLQAGKDAWQVPAAQDANPDRAGVILAAIALPTDTTSRWARMTFGRAFEAMQQVSAAPGGTASAGLAGHLGRRVVGFPAALLAKALGLKGGSCTLDAACASSIYAVKLACDRLSSHRADVMLAGGVSRPECLYTQVGFSQLRALSPSGRCAPFDRSADGLVVGEGAGILVLKRLDDALAHGDPVHAVIRGIGLSNDMAGNLLAPAVEGQVRAMRGAYDSAGWSPADVDLIECHGAGTPVGDMTELRSLEQLWRRISRAPYPCAIGSVKSMIGHLLTAAGAAGMIKTVLALSHRTLPPQIHFDRAPDNSPLLRGPFKVQVEPSKWSGRSTKAPRRAAVSAFGFGGINGHLLLEEWKGAPSHRSRRFRVEKKPEVPIAIVGMAAAVGRLSNLREFKEAVFNGRDIFTEPPESRWKGCNRFAESWFGLGSLRGGFMERLDLEAGAFRIPPNEIPDILLQQLVMLRVAAGAMADAGMSAREERPAMGAIIGIDFDYETTDFHLRWHLSGKVDRWAEDFGKKRDDPEVVRWLESLQDACAPPLTASRTLGALGSVVASRLAGEFQFGGPSFAVSSEAMSGLDAVEIAVRALQAGEMSAVLAGAVDMTGDLRRMAGVRDATPFSASGSPKPFDRLADGTLPGEGAVALVLKPLDLAREERNRVYGVIRGIGKAADGGVEDSLPSPDAYRHALELAVSDAKIQVSSIGYVETHGSGVSGEDRCEADGLNGLFGHARAALPPSSVAVGSVKPNIGHTGAASGLFSLAKTVLCLYHEIIPPLANFSAPKSAQWENGCFYLPRYAHHWVRDRGRGRRRACTGAMSPDGQVMHVVIESAEPDADAAYTETSRRERVRAPEEEAAGRFVVEGNDPQELLHDLRGLAGKPAGRTIRRVVGGGAMRRVPAPPPQGERTAETSQGVPSTAKFAWRAVMDDTNAVANATTEAHQAFLAFSEELAQSYGRAVDLQSRMTRGLPENRPSAAEKHRPPEPCSRKPAFSREQCMEFAVGSAAEVLGAEFAAVDTYPVRVRLPDAPLMLVDRILEIRGEKASLAGGQVVTEHDVLPGAWYLDGGRAPVCIAVEAGQADLFLSAYLGIDLAVKGRRAYRLLDATVRFHRDLPTPGETVRYTITIEKFLRQGETYLFFFHFEGFVGETPLIRMKNGCAGFFTAEEVDRSGGIIFTAKERLQAPGILPPDWQPPVPLSLEPMDEAVLNRLRAGDLQGAFGDPFKEMALSPNLRLPGGRMKLIDRILELDPDGGRYGIGRIRAESDIRPGDWFLTCHFVDDMTMPGTLMYECCAHALRVFVLRMGWISEKPEVRFEPVTGVDARLKCRGPVTPQTRKVVYEVEIREIGLAPEPRVIADALMYADGRPIVFFENLSLRVAGTTHEEIEALWRRSAPKKSKPCAAASTSASGARFDRNHILAFARGNPSDAFGAPYRVFDRERTIARLPAPPYSFIDRVTRVEPDPWVLKPDGWVEAQYEVQPDAWFFAADGTDALPFCVLLEIALQPCGWLAAYMGSALRSHDDLKFRNLGGTALLHRCIRRAQRTLTTRVKLRKFSEAGSMIIEHFEFQVHDEKGPVYTGDTNFGFFTRTALRRQVGLSGDPEPMDPPSAKEMAGAESAVLPDRPPLEPEDPASAVDPGLCLPSRALRMVDTIDIHIPDGGAKGLGFVRGSKTVNPDEWFFKAHFHQDPVCPGSLGIDALLQLVRFAAMKRWHDRIETHRFELLTGRRHRWVYRGQIVPQNTLVEVDAVIVDVQQSPQPEIRANGFLRVDGRTIYGMENFGYRLVPLDGPP